MCPPPRLFLPFPLTKKTILHYKQVGNHGTHRLFCSSSFSLSRILIHWVAANGEVAPPFEIFPNDRFFFQYNRGALPSVPVPVVDNDPSVSVFTTSGLSQQCSVLGDCIDTTPELERYWLSCGFEEAHCFEFSGTYSCRCWDGYGDAPCALEDSDDSDEEDGEADEEGFQIPAFVTPATVLAAVAATMILCSLRECFCVKKKKKPTRNGGYDQAASQAASSVVPNDDGDSEYNGKMALMRQTSAASLTGHRNNRRRRRSQERDAPPPYSAGWGGNPRGNLKRSSSSRLNLYTKNKPPGLNPGPAVPTPSVPRVNRSKAKPRISKVTKADVPIRLGTKKRKPVGGTPPTAPVVKRPTYVRTTPLLSRPTTRSLRLTRAEGLAASKKGLPNNAPLPPASRARRTPAPVAPASSAALSTLHKAQVTPVPVSTSRSAAGRAKPTLPKPPAPLLTKRPSGSGSSYWIGLEPRPAQKTSIFDLAPKRPPKPSHPSPKKLQPGSVTGKSLRPIEFSSGLLSFSGWQDAGNGVWKAPAGQETDLKGSRASGRLATSSLRAERSPKKSRRRSTRGTSGTAPGGVNLPQAVTEKSPTSGGGSLTEVSSVGKVKGVKGTQPRSSAATKSASVAAMGLPSGLRRRRPEAAPRGAMSNGASQPVRAAPLPPPSPSASSSSGASSSGSNLGVPSSRSGARRRSKSGKSSGKSRSSKKK